jgi:hypothetical protein
MLLGGIGGRVDGLAGRVGGIVDGIGGVVDGVGGKGGGIVDGIGGVIDGIDGKVDGIDASMKPLAPIRPWLLLLSKEVLLCVGKVLTGCMGAAAPVPVTPLCM